MKKRKYLLLLLTLLCLNIKNVKADSIPNKIYTIKSFLSGNKVVDLDGAITSNYSNIQLFDSNDTKAQKWYFEQQSDGYYIIKSSINKNKAIDMYGNSRRNGTNINLYDSNGTSAQRWDIIYRGQSQFTIKAIDSDYCMDIYGGLPWNKNNIQLYMCNNTTAQRFKLVPEVVKEKTIEDGEYIINSSKDENKVINLKDGKTSNNTNVNIYQNNNVGSQKWIITYQKNGYYTIKSKLNKNKCLDIAGANFISDTNVQVYDCNNTDAQMWAIAKNTDDTYSIISKGDGLTLDIYGGDTANNTNVQVYFNNETQAQKFKFTKIENDNFLENGTYTISNNASPKNNAIDVSEGKSYADKKIWLWSSNNTNAQKWFITKNDDNSYYIKSGLNSNLYLSTSNNSAITSLTAKKWELQYKSENVYYIIDPDTGLYLNLDNSSLADGTSINLMSESSGIAQEWYFDLTEINEKSPTLTDGYYTISSILNNNKAIDIAGASKTNGTNIQLYDSNKTMAQNWYLKSLGNGYYTITSSLNPNITLDLTSGSTQSGTNIQLYKANGTDAQIWRLKDDQNGNIEIISKKANISLTVANGKTQNGANIQAETSLSNNNQKFKFDLNNINKVYTGIDISYHQEKREKINWEALANTNINFVVLRIGWGDNFTSQDDASFKNAVANCEKYNIPYAVYLYSYATKVDGTDALNKDSASANSEAKHVLRVLNSVSHKPNLKTSVYLDMEDNSTANLPSSTLSAIANRFCSIIEGNGYGCSVYANAYWLNQKLDTRSITTNNRVWVAHYGSNNITNHSQAMTTTVPYNLTNYKLWQFSSRGQVSGVHGNVDLDLGYNIFD